MYVTDSLLQGEESVGYSLDVSFQQFTDGTTLSMTSRGIKRLVVRLYTLPLNVHG